MQPQDMDRIAKFLILLVAALVLVPGCFAEETTNESAIETVAEEVAVIEGANVTVLEETEVVEMVNETVVEEVTEVLIPDFEADMSVITPITMGVDQTVAISLVAEDDGIWNVTTTEGLEQVGNSTVTNGTELFTIKAIAAGEQAFSAVHEAVDETAAEAGETYTLDIIVE